VLPVEEGEGSRLAALRAGHALLLEENKQYKELFILLRNKSQPESHEILRRIRLSEDPIYVLKYIKQAESILHNPSIDTTDFSTQIGRIDAEALSNSCIVVPAHPWTASAGDGIVSELISSYFKWESAFIWPFIDQDAFVEDMRTQDAQRSKYCSALLVNAICATRSVGKHYNALGFLFKTDWLPKFTSQRVRDINALSKTNLGLRFLDEAKKHLDIEGGRSSIATVQGLSLLFNYSALMGMDRAALAYRYTALSMLKQMHLERTYAKLSASPVQEERAMIVISKLVWGSFCYDR
jgi:hypothetical protein